MPKNQDEESNDEVDASLRDINNDWKKYNYNKKKTYYRSNC